MSGIGAHRAYAQRQRDGVPAKFNGFCPSCDTAIVAGQTHLVMRGGRWVCAACGKRDDE